MRISPSLIRHIHFVGIGGIGMSGIAEVLHNLGYFVTGSDAGESANVKRLQSLGIRVMVGQREENIQGAQVIVVSTAISKDNPEVVAARAIGIPIVQRAEMLGELMRLKLAVAIAGTHGKTTTTSLMANLFDAAELNPTVVNGGILNAYNTNAKLGSGDWIVVEADESDGSFTKLFPTLAIVTNIDEDHMDFYPDLASIKKAFCTFLDRVPFYGAAILCHDHPVVRELAKDLGNKRVITYGLEQGAHIRAVNLRATPEGTEFDVDITPPHFQPSLTSVSLMPRRIRQLFLPMVGEHNVQNALTLIAVAGELGIPDHVVAKALRDFAGVKRRFTKVGEVGGVRIIDDYAHHPVEIEKTLKAAKQATDKKVVAVFQPHRFTRLKALYSDFLNCFTNADELIITPVYGAGESPLPEACPQKLVKDLVERGIKARYVDALDQLPSVLKDIVKEGDLILCMGAGTITYTAATLAEHLSPLLGQGPLQQKLA